MSTKKTLDKDASLALLKDLQDSKKELGQKNKELKEKEEKYKNLLETLQVGILVADAKTKKFVFANPYMINLIGYSKEELLKLDVSKIHPKKDLPLVLKQFARQMKKEILVAPSLPVLRKDRRVVYCDITSNPIIFNGKKSLLGIFVDVTEKKKAEEELKESEERFKLIAETTNDLIYEWDIKTDELEWYGNIDVALGYKKGEFPRTLKAWLGSIHPQDLKDVEKIVKKQRKTTGVVDIEYRIKNKKGTYLTWIDRGLIITDKNKKPIKQIGACTDITKQKEAKEIIEESQKRFQDLVESSSDWIWEVDMEGKYTYTSEGIEKVLGYSPNEVIGKSPFYFMPKKEAARVGIIFKKIIKNKGKIIDLENLNLHKNGSKVILNTSAVPYFSKDGKLKGYRGIDRDVTNIKNSQFRLMEKIRELEEMNALMVGRELKMIELKKKIK